MILVMTNDPYLRVGRHNYYRNLTSVIHRVRSYFRKPTIRTIVILTGGKLTGFYFLPLLYAIYYSVMTHLQKGKKVGILPRGDVNSGPIPSRRGLLEDSSYRAVGAACLSCNWPQPRT
jgi:hypothetical protein